MKKLLLLLLPLLFCSCVSLLNRTTSVTNQHYIHDSNGRIVIYHGVNISNYSKNSPDRLPWQTPSDYARLNRWGFNIVRLLIFWEAIEPSPDVYDTAYVYKIKDIICTLQRLGIDVLLDFHQDLMSRKFTGDGFPEWAIHDAGLPFKQQTPWAKNYTQPPVIAAFTYFWRSDTLQSHYLRAIEFVVSIVGIHDNVVGVDVFNEPFLGLLSEDVTLKPFYNKVDGLFSVLKVRVFFEPSIITSTGIETKLTYQPSGLGVYAPHYYDVQCENGLPYQELNKAILGVAIKTKFDEAISFRTPLIFGEFGMSPRITGQLEFYKDFVRLADRFSIGWITWSYDKQQYNEFGIVDDSGKEMPHLNTLVEIYPQRIAGTEPIYGVNRSQFNLTYKRSSCNAPTVIFIPSQLTNVQVTHNNHVVDYQAKYDGRVEIRNDGNPNQNIKITWK